MDRRSLLPRLFAYAYCKLLVGNEVRISVGLVLHSQTGETTYRLYDESKGSTGFRTLRKPI